MGRMLIEGFQAHDNAAELRNRVEDLPPELEDLFHHILGKIPSRFLDHTTKFLRVCWTNRKHALDLGFPYDLEISALALSWADENKFEIDSLGNFKAWSPEEMRHNCSMLRGRLRSRCMGLLEIHGGTLTTNPELENSDVPSLSVDFMHRTLFEFLNTPGVWELKCLSIRDQTFDATTVLTYMSAQILYIATFTSISRGHLSVLCVDYLHLLQKSMPGNLQVALEKLTGALLQIQRRDGKPVWSKYLSSGGIKVKADDPDYSCSTTGIRDIEIDDSNMNQTIGSVQNYFPLDLSTLLLAIEFALTSYVQSTIKGIQMQQLYPLLRYPLLYHAIQLPILSSLSNIHTKARGDNFLAFHTEDKFGKGPPTELIRILLQHGCSLNEQFLDQNGTFTTPWMKWLEKCSSIPATVARNYSRFLPFANTTLMMLEAGTNVKHAGLKGVGMSNARDRDAALMRMNKIWLESTTEEWGEKWDTNRIKLIEICNDITQAMV